MIRRRQYAISAHATDEMAEDSIDIIDVEHAMLHGQIMHIVRDDPRGTKYVIEGIAADRSTPVGVVGQFSGI